MKSKLLLLHVGKTGGTFLRNYINKYNIIFIKPIRHKGRIRDGNYILGIRCPIERAVSGFFSRYRCMLDSHKWERYKLTKKEIKIFEYYNKTYDSFNDMCEDLYSSNKDKEVKAQNIFNCVTHLFMDINFYVEGIEHLKSNINKIIYVLCTETLESDFKKLLNDYNTEFFNTKEIYKHSSLKIFDNKKKLSDKARINIIKWYKKDYEIIELLYFHKKISSDYYNYINRYKYLLE